MLNDFRNKNFWTVKNEKNEISYYICLQGKWLKVTKDVYSVYKNSYQKMYRDSIKQKDILELTEAIENQYIKGKSQIEEMYGKELESYLKKIIQQLPEDEYTIIQKMFYEEQTERQTAKSLGISNTALHYKKVKILKKLKKILEQNDI